MSDNVALSQRAADAERKLHELAAAVHNETPTVQAERSELSSLRAQVPELIANLQAAKLASDEAHNINVSLKKDLDKVTKQADEAKETARVHYTQFSTLADEHKLLEDKHAELQSQLGHATSKNQELHNMVASCQQQLIDLQFKS